jgi:hypothetical protein
MEALMSDSSKGSKGRPTPGQWEQHYYSPESAGKFGGEPGHYVVARVVSPDGRVERSAKVCDVTTSAYIGHEEAEANAKAIAALPALAEALRGVQAWMETDMKDFKHATRVYDAVLAALAGL